jgi:site-specific DNA-methyltransferase (adenine-specific)
MIEPRKGYRFFNADCMDIMQDVPDKYFDLAVVDPEYGINESAKGSQSRPHIARQKNGQLLKVKSNNHLQKDWDKKRPDTKYFKEIIRISKNQIIWGGNYFADMLSPSPAWIVWNKINGNNDFADCELAWTSFKTSVRLFSFMWAGMRQGNSTNGLIMQGNKNLNEVRIHPTQKPKALYKWIYEKYCPEGAKVIDTHLGSNSNGIAAYFSKKVVEFWGIEKDKDYYRDGVNRFIKETSDMYNPAEVETI